MSGKATQNPTLAHAAFQVDPETGAMVLALTNSRGGVTEVRGEELVRLVVTELSAKFAIAAGKTAARRIVQARQQVMVGDGFACAGCGGGA